MFVWCQCIPSPFTNGGSIGSILRGGNGGVLARNCARDPPAMYLTSFIFFSAASPIGWCDGIWCWGMDIHAWTSIHGYPCMQNRTGPSTVLYSTVQYCKVLYSTVQYCTVLYSSVQYCAVLYSTVQYCTVLYSTVQYSGTLGPGT